MKNKRLIPAALAMVVIASSMSALAVDAGAEWVKNGDSYSFLDKNGKKLTGWVKIGSKKYYFGSDGKMRTGMIKLDGKTYYFGNDGVMRTGKVSIKGKTYDFGTDGVLKTASSTKVKMPDVKWTMTKSDITKFYAGSENVLDIGFVYIAGSWEKAAMYGFDPENEKLMFYSVTSTDGLAAARKKLKNDGYKYVEKVTEDGKDAYVYKKGTNYAVAAESEGITMIIYLSPALSIAYAAKGKEGLQEEIDSYYDSIGTNFSFHTPMF